MRIPAGSMKIAIALAVLGLLGGNDAEAAALKSDGSPDAQAACVALVGKIFDGGEVLAATLVAADGVRAPEHCSVTGRIAGSDINFVARLPSTWNGKAVMGASGGWQGSLTIGFRPSVAASPLSQGYADYMTDAGHTGKGPGSVALDTRWFAQPGALANFAGISHEHVTKAVQSMLKERYGKQVDRTYFDGCSGGGHIALLMAQRYPRLFDGIVAGAPAATLVGTFLNWQNAAKAMRIPGAALSQGRLKTLSAAILAQCDALDGAKDGIVSNPLACTFDPEPLRCTRGDSDECLTDAQMNLVKATTRDTVYKDGSVLFKGFRLLGQEDDPANLPNWTAGSPSFYEVATRAVIRILARDPNADPIAYAIHDDENNVRNLSSLLDAWPGDLAQFGAAGRKLIIWQGTADGSVPFENTITYHDSAVASLGGMSSAKQTLRSFFPPGVNHCGGGVGADNFDYLAALDAWVTNNEPPDGKRITRIVNGEEVMSRPLCAYPTWPKYNGTGDINSASSFSCVETQ